MFCDANYIPPASRCCQNLPSAWLNSTHTTQLVQNERDTFLDLPLSGFQLFDLLSDHRLGAEELQLAAHEVDGEPAEHNQHAK